jgi:hypothetical protein
VLVVNATITLPDFQITDPEMETQVIAFITEKREKGLAVTRRKVKEEAKRLSSCTARFVASDCWLKGFMQRHGLSMRKKSTGGQKLPLEHLRLLTSFWLDIYHIR